jgi:5'-nucleotidase
MVYDAEPSLNVPNLKPSIVLEVGGRKIGIIGYLTPETKEVAIENKVELLDEVVAVK